MATPGPNLELTEHILTDQNLLPAAPGSQSQLSAFPANFMSTKLAFIKTLHYSGSD